MINLLDYWVIFIDTNLCVGSKMSSVRQSPRTLENKKCNLFLPEMSKYPPLTCASC